jgi:hypothetical protein
VTAYDAGPGKYVTDPNNPKTEPGFPNFTYVVEKQYMAQPSKVPAAASENWGKCDPDSTDSNITCDPPGTNLIRVTVTVQWDDNNTYTTYGLVAG